MSTTQTGPATRAGDLIAESHVSTKRRRIKSYYPRSFFIPAVVLYRRVLCHPVGRVVLLLTD